ncbi:hypothetical protein V8E51_004531 [Hyaloscypha variabilis]|uniref:GPI anchored serine-rich protein n=1 Tax=Hyaloscypha variabilis (strain UAMH 11265 / GT02V1 / F) TaxID=1149755 RepID=A0A2J6RDF2_HYAVF|nr:hypothetical protein L207DRAFT_532141 [Hyaloscypha variabilis F]
MASVAAAETYYSTTSTTVIDTITSCGPEVTNCPARTHTSTLSTPAVYANTSVPCTTSTAAAATYPVSVPSYPASSPSVALGTTYITTCIPTVITSVYTVTPTASPSSSYVTYAKNSTTPTYSAKSVPTYTGAASAVQGSVVLAAAAGIVAFFA